ncbi:MAG: putative ABC transporter permease [Oscillospiraceae bacterium]|nr:putative ABC transporter permease [Oscillospiraceae bacterium]MBR1898643.1 putative ABC transporter permease [Oscillospiraceae bacterium]
MTETMRNGLESFESFASMSLEYLFLSFMLYSFLGWLFETTIVSLWESGHFLNRGSLLGPYCPVYGGGAILGVVMGAYIQNPVVLFFTSATLCIFCELLCATILEDIFHVKLWDYSGIPYNFKGRICLLGYLFFGIAATTISKVVEPNVLRLFDKVRPEIITATAILLAIVLAADTIFSAIAFSRKSRKLYRFYIRYHAMLNREFRGLSYKLQNKTPTWIRADLVDMQEAILRKNRRMNSKHLERKERLEEKVEEKLDRFRKD